MWRRDIGCKRYQWPVLKMTTSWKVGASTHLLSGTSMSTRYPSLYPRDSSTPPLALGDHLCKGKQLFYKCFENVNWHLTAALKKITEKVLYGLGPHCFSQSWKVLKKHVYLLDGYNQVQSLGNSCYY